jgi:hypothetical protein
MERPLPNSLDNTPTKHIRAYKQCLAWQEKNGKKAIAKGIVKALTLPDDNYDFTNTEIIGAINTLATDLISKSERGERTLLLYSDTFENSRLTTFFRKGAIRLIDPKAEIAKIKKANMIPNLSGIKVYVIGAAGSKTAAFTWTPASSKPCGIFGRPSLPQAAQHWKANPSIKPQAVHRFPKAAFPSTTTPSRP